MTHSQTVNGARARQARRWAVRAAAAIGVMLTYFVVTNHVALTPWNNLDAVQSQLLSTLVGVIPFSIYGLGFALGIRPLMLVGTVHSYIWLALQIRQWWVPYLLGPTPLHRDLSWYWEGGYGETMQVLPAIAGRPVPDAQHLVLELLSLVVVVTTTIALALAFPRRGPGSVAAPATREAA